MATCRDIIKKAYRRIGVVAAGREPSASMAEEALGHLVDQYKAWVADGLFGRFRDVPITAATYTALEQDRISIADENSCAITFPDLITQEWQPYAGAFANDYGFMIGGTGGYLQTVGSRRPRDQSAILVTTLCDCDTRIRVYDASAARWQRIDTLELGDTAPLSMRHEKQITDILAGNIAEGFGREIGPKLASDIATALSSLSHKWDRPRRTVQAEYF